MWPYAVLYMYIQSIDEAATSESTPPEASSATMFVAAADTAGAVVVQPLDSAKLQQVHTSPTTVASYNICSSKQYCH
jgi:hypothetical protein